MLGYHGDWWSLCGCVATSTLTSHGRESQAGLLCGVGYTLYIIHITFHILPLLK